MKTWLSFVSVVLFSTVGMVPVSYAQQGCKPTALSCTQINKNCEDNCRARGNNAAACVAQYCSTTLTTCKANGLWKSNSSGAACWTVTNRS